MSSMTDSSSFINILVPSSTKRSTDHSSPMLQESTEHSWIFTNDEAATGTMHSPDEESDINTAYPEQREVDALVTLQQQEESGTATDSSYEESNAATHSSDEESNAVIRSSDEESEAIALSPGLEEHGTVPTPEKDIPMLPHSLLDKVGPSKILSSLRTPCSSASPPWTSSSPRGNAFSPRSRLQATMEPEFVMPSPTSSFQNDSWIDARPASVTVASTTRQRRPTSSRQCYNTNKSHEEHQVGQKVAQSLKGFVLGVGRTIAHLWEHFLRPILPMICSICSAIFGILQPILVILAALWIILLFCSKYGSLAIPYALSPVCHVPGSSYLSWCAVPKRAEPPDFEGLMNVQSTLEDIMAVTAGAYSLPFAMKRTESSVRSLSAAVQYSSLTSRNELLFEFESFIQIASKASQGLSSFYVHVGGTVDRILSTNRWTIRRLIQIDEDEKHRGNVNRIFNNLLPGVFDLVQIAEDRVLEQYIAHTRIVENEIASAISRAKILLQQLEELEKRLNNIQLISVRDGVILRVEREKLLEQLWSKLGGNRNWFRTAEEQLSLLASVELHRKTAWNHVSATIVNLQNVAAGLNYLETQLMNPPSQQHRDHPPLRVHIAHIEGAVERLGMERTRFRKVQDDLYDKIMDTNYVEESTAVTEL